VRAKGAMPVAGTPLVTRILAWLGYQGVRDAVLNLHHRAETIAGVVGDGAALGMRVRYSWENPILGSAGGPRRALPLIGADRFFIINGDILTDLDLATLERAHLESRALVTMAVVPNPDPHRYGGVLVDRNGSIVGFPRPGAENQGLHFISVQVVEASAFQGLDPNRAAESVGQLYPELIRSRPGCIRAHVSTASFLDVGTLGSYTATCRQIAAAEGWSALPFGRNVRVAPSARTDGSILWDDVTIGMDCRVVDCVVADGVTIPGGATFEGCAIVRADGRRPDPGETPVGDLLVTRIV
jgi:NDP-sugar pyrophosphorylase family protein